MSAEERLAAVGIVLPEPPRPVAAYVPFVRTGNLVFTAGQITFAGGEVKYRGKLGRELTVDDGYQAARLCGINALAVLKAALGSLDRVSRVVKLVVFVASAEGFTDQAKVANGASELMGEVFGEAGRHARAAVGVAELPLGSPCEVEVVAEVAG